MTDKFAILDLEWTAWEGSVERGWSGPDEEIEIVQFGMAVYADTAAIEEVDSLEVLVRPQINPDLSDYFTQLTGITQEDVDREGIAFPDALGRGSDFLGNSIDTIHCFGSDGNVLHINCDLMGIAPPFPLDLFNSVRKDVAEFLGLAEHGVASSDLPELMGFDVPGQAHTALADVRCIAEALRIMRGVGAF